MSTPPHPPSSSAARPALPPNISRVLQRLSRKDFFARTARFPLLVAALLPLFWLAQGLVDFAFELSWAARLILLVADAAFAGWLFYRHVWLPARRRLNLRAAALLVERSFPQFRTGLVTVVEFSTSGDLPSAKGRELVQLLLGRVSRQVDQTDILRGIVKLRPLWRLLGATLASAAAFAAILWYFQPHSLILARRVFLSSEALPRRTLVLPVSRDLMVNTGTDIELSARATGIIPKTGRLVVLYPDGRSETVPAAPRPSEPSVFTANLRNVLQPFRYRFEINDGTGQQFQVSTRTLPSLARTKFVYRPPSYTGRPETELSAGSLSVLEGGMLLVEGEATQPLRSAVLELKGLNRTIPMDNDDPVHNTRLRIEANEARVKEIQERLEKLTGETEAAAADLDSAKKAQEEAKKARDAAAPGDEQRRLNYRWELAGNEVRHSQGEADRTANQLKQERGEMEGVQRQIAEQKKWMEEQLKAPPPDQATLEKRKRIVRAEIPIPKDGLTGLSIHTVNEEGLASENDPVYRVNLLPDRPPTIEINEPKSDQKTVLAWDKVPIKYTVRDDYKIEKIDLKYVILRPNVEGEAVPSEEGVVSLAFPPGAVNASGEYLMKLSSFVPPLTEGCVISYYIDARDYYTLYQDGNVSRKMSLIVVSPEKKKEEFREEMGKAGEQIGVIIDRQGKSNDKTGSSIKQ